MKATYSLLAVALLVGVTGCDGNRSAPAAVHADGMTIEVAVEPASLRVGENTVWLELRGEDGRAAAGAEVEVSVRMHAMGAMPAMGGPAAVTELGGGRYRADFELGMGGTWNIEIAARIAAGPTARVEGSLTVGSPGVRLKGAPTGASEAAGKPTPDDRPPGEFRIEPSRLQRIGVKVARAQKKPMTVSLRTVGRVVSEETTLEDVSLKVRGWVGEIHVDAVGDPVERGEVLFAVYSPELYAAQEEYLQALRSQQRARTTAAPDRADYLVTSARNRLRLWDIADADLDRVERAGKPIEHLPIRAPVSGYVAEKNIVEGAAFAPGDRLYRIASLTHVWIEVQVYESDLPLVEAGQRATVTLPYLPERRLDAEVAYVYPTLDRATRTGRLRLELPNPDRALRPDMYANVQIHADRGERLVVPESSVLHAGERSFVFRALGDGRFRPQAVEVGLRSGDEVEIREGISEGDEIVTSGTFLIASESRLRAALEQW